VPGLGDLLHLVSGRTLLGVVRERQVRRLGAPPGPPSLEHERAANRLGAPPDPPSFLGHGAHQRLPGDGQAPFASDEGALVEGDGYMEGRGHARSRAQHPVEERAAAQSQPLEEGGRMGLHGPVHDEGAQVLEMLIGEELVAVAVRQKQPGRSASHAAGAAHDQCTAAAGVQGASPGAAGEQAGPGQAGEGAGARSGAGGGDWSVRVYSAEGALLSEERGGVLRAPGRGVPFSVVRSATPLVRHLYFVAETGAGVPYPQLTLGQVAAPFVLLYPERWE
jgi:hypothetical protein